MRLTKKKAKELSIKKWGYAVKNGGKINVDHLRVDVPELKHLLHECGYCQIYFYDETKTISSCGKCPIRPKIKDYDDLNESGCEQSKHPHRIWWLEKTKENARAVLDLIKNS